MAIGANAYNVDDFIYTRAAKYKVTAANLVTNGELKGASLDGWTATDPSAAGLADIFKVGTDGGVTVNSGMNALENGMYQVVNIDKGGTYVVTLKVKGAEDGYTDVDLYAAGNNYIFAYFNTDGTLSTKGGNKNVELSFGEGGAAIENCYSFTADDFTELAFPVEAPSDGKIVIDLRALTGGIEIKDIECHAVSEVFDERKANSRLAWIKSVLGSFNWTDEYTAYADLKENITQLENAIAAKDDAKAATMLENLEACFKDDFAPNNLSNVFKTINHPDGAGGNYCADWMEWTAKYNKCISEAPTQPWVFNCDRWAHKTNAANSPLQVQWMRGYAYNNWDPQARLTTTLEKGSYRLGVSGSGGMMTMNKDRWKRSGAYDNVNVELILENAEDPTKNDTIVKGTLSPSFDQDFIGEFTVDADKEVTIYMHCYQTDSPSALPGIDVALINPVLYKVLVQGELTPEQKGYLANVQTQIAAVEDRIKVAEELVAATQTEKPWGKDNLQKGIDQVKKRLATWKALDEKALLDLFLEDEVTYNAAGEIFYVDGEYITMDSVYREKVLTNVIMNAGVRYLNNEFINVFNSVNTPLTDMPAAIEAAKAAKEQRIFSSSTKKAALENEITRVENLYKEKLAAAYSAENAQALVDAKAALALMVEEFKAAIQSNVLVDIDFEGASFVKHEDPSGEADTYYTIAGKAGEMKIGEVAEALGTTLYELGYRASAEAETDSVGMLRVGGSSATVDFTAAPANATDIVRVSFDYYFGNLTTKYAGYYLTAGTDTICGLFCSMYDGKDTYNTLGVDYNAALTKVGSGSASNAAIAAVASNKSHFEVVLDYGNKTMYCTTTSGKGTFTTAEVALDPTKKVTGFILASDYSNTDRRCWFDNLKVESIAVSESTGINEVATAVKADKVVKAIENGQLVIKTANGTFSAVGAKIK